MPLVRLSVLYSLLGHVLHGLGSRGPKKSLGLGLIVAKVLIGFAHGFGFDS